MNAGFTPEIWEVIEWELLTQALSAQNQKIFSKVYDGAAVIRVGIVNVFVDFGVNVDIGVLDRLSTS